ncbi:MAG TPA: ASCH domain-containing protein [Paludibacteraceae bacterium]|nr:ASCH domain-containing protein [Paludibacteraceae bacterium]HOS37449.1 ASCH domain-containing protein [Paludibacteraceae bacterium]HPK20345.1 ASCH domain-containing protein [Paludibacteraceae bacterium]
MILTFSRDEFVEKIKNGTKTHTIREDKGNRWKVGKTIHFWRGNPRNVKNNPYQFGTGKVADYAFIEIYPKINEVIISYISDTNGVFFMILNTPSELNILAESDGFEDWEDMKTFFREDFKGKLIFWYDFKPTK